VHAPATSTTPTLQAAPGRWPVPPLVAASVGVHGAAALGALAWPPAWPLALGAVVANHALLTAAGLWPRSALLGPNVRRLDAAASARGAWALTIDDGPDPAVTPAVLDLLAAHGEGGTKATFFCIAERAAAHPVLLRRIVAAGHSVQNHSLRHRHNFSLLGPRGFEREIGQAQQVLADITGQRPHCFRAPAGLRNPLLDPVLHRLGLHLVSWSRRGFDTRVGNTLRVLEKLGAGPAGGLRGGDIVLLHDGHARRGDSGRPVVLDVLPALLQHAARAGLHAVTLQAALPPRHAAAAAGALA
jgi:peptidoglycan/xylan/chitin deacetylase (PgdA/CDA1 family)